MTSRSAAAVTGVAGVTGRPDRCRAWSRLLLLVGLAATIGLAQAELPAVESPVKTADRQLQPPDTQAAAAAGDAPAEAGFFGQTQRLNFVNAFVASISVIIVSELGDKTFFIAAIMAMRQNRWTVFSAAISALVLMTLLSSVLGMATSVIPRSFTHYASIVLFLVFGLKMLKDGWTMTEEEGKEEFEEVQKTLSKKETTTDLEYNLLGSTEDPETGVIRTVKGVAFTTRIKRKLMQFVSLVFIETFTMTFLAEWGDRSQIATVILAARENVFGVTLGACIGHALCTGLAVLGGRFIATMISVRTVTLAGGVIFILFAISAVLLEQ